MKDWQVELNKIYPDAECVYCGRKYPDTVLNLEGHMHHGEPMRCIDLKSCHREARKEKRRNSGRAAKR